MDLAQFKSDLKDSELITNPKNNFIDLNKRYHSVLSYLVNRHAPLATMTCFTRPRDPWITSEALEAKRRKRQLECVWRRTRSDSVRSRLNSQVYTCNRLMSKAKSDYYTKTGQ